MNGLHTWLETTLPFIIEEFDTKNIKYPTSESISVLEYVVGHLSNHSLLHFYYTPEEEFIIEKLVSDSKHILTIHLDNSLYYQYISKINPVNSYTLYAQSDTNRKGYTSKEAFKIYTLFNE